MSDKKQESILPYEITYWMNPANSKNHGNKDCERLHHDLYFGAMHIGWGNLNRLREKNLTIIGLEDKIFLKYLFLVSESDSILRDRLEFLSECFLRPKDDDLAYKDITHDKAVLQRYHSLLDNCHQTKAQGDQTSVCQSVEDSLQTDIDKS